MSSSSAAKATDKRIIRVGTRKSQLALIQTHHVVNELEKIFPDVAFEIVARTTLGDERLDVALSKIGEKSLFTKELEVCLETGEVDFVVHSLKDLPTTLPQAMVIGAILEREDPRDAVVIRSGSSSRSLSSLPPGSTVGTSSVRRCAQIRARYPDLRIADVRGNLNTRLKKLDEGDDRHYDALILAAAGIKRMGWGKRISQVLDHDECLHAVGQGAIAVECREGDDAVLDVVGVLHHRPTLLAAIAERAFMRRLEGGCSAPVAAHAELVAGKEEIKMDGGVWSLDGARMLRRSKVLALKEGGGGEENGVYSSAVARKMRGSDLAAAQRIGLELAEELIAEGAWEILQEAKKMNNVVA